MAGSYGSLENYLFVLMSRYNRKEADMYQNIAAMQEQLIEEVEGEKRRSPILQPMPHGKQSSCYSKHRQKIRDEIFK